MIFENQPTKSKISIVFQHVCEQQTNKLLEDTDLDEPASSANSLRDFLSPPSIDRPRARSEGCSGLQPLKPQMSRDYIGR